MNCYILGYKLNLLSPEVEGDEICFYSFFMLPSGAAQTDFRCVSVNDKLQSTVDLNPHQGAEFLED